MSSLLRMLRTWLSTVFGLRKRGADAGVRSSSGHQAEYLDLALGQFREAGRAGAVEEQCDDLRVNNRAPVANALHRVHQLSGMGDVLLE